MGRPGTISCWPASPTTLERLAADHAALPGRARSRGASWPDRPAAARLARRRDGHRHARRRRPAGAMRGPARAGRRGGAALPRPVARPGRLGTCPASRQRPAGHAAQVRRALEARRPAAGRPARRRHALRAQNALLAAEEEIEGGASPRVAPFADVRDLGALLQRAVCAARGGCRNGHRHLRRSPGADARAAGMGAANALRAPTAASPLRRATLRERSRSTRAFRPSQRPRCPRRSRSSR